MIPPADHDDAREVAPAEATDFVVGTRRQRRGHFRD